MQRVKKRPRGLRPIDRSPRVVIPDAGAAQDRSGVSKKLHREALAGAIDPEIAFRKLIASTQEGGQRFIPANKPPPMKLLKVCVESPVAKGVALVTPLVAGTCEPQVRWPIGHRWASKYQLPQQRTTAIVSILADCS